MPNGPTKKPIDIPTRETFNFLSSHLHPGATVLEIGCGDGEVASELTRKGSRSWADESWLLRNKRANEALNRVQDSEINIVLRLASSDELALCYKK